MNDILKQRLVGALILIALAVLFWPIIFVEPGELTTQQRDRYTERPVVDTNPLPEPSQAGLSQSPPFEARVTELLEDSQQAELDAQERNTAIAESEAPATDTSAKPVTTATEQQKTAAKQTAAVPKTRTEAPPKPVLDAQGVPVAWILQVASVANQDKAETLRLRLLDMGHKAFVKKVRAGDKLLWRVYIGPKFEKVKLEQVQAGINAEFGVQTMVRRYVP